MSKNHNIATPELVARYMKAGVNIMLIGDHGVGKTSVVRKACELLGYNLKEFNGALMEPYIDLIGIPDIDKSTDGEKTLSMVNQKSLRDAHVVFMDEYNRARVETKNATMTMVNDHQLNGEDLPNLKSVVAACNPSESNVTGSKYSVGSVDPAQMDRFTIKLTMSNRVDKKYLIKALGKKNLATVLADWQNSLEFDKDDKGKSKAPYVSPRTIERLGKIFLLFPEVSTVWHVLGDDANMLNTNSLAKNMLTALNKDTLAEERSEEIRSELADGETLDDMLQKHINTVSTSKTKKKKREAVNNAMGFVINDYDDLSDKEKVEAVMYIVHAATA